mmetsp:Transcript_5819/g.12347  ORF Transcript_5819/g.12347 Transcript_5819/m.12347 type:complete len:343 (+) Transcript_5819:87-1115(+)
MTPKSPFKLLPPETLPCKPILTIGLPSSAEWAESMSHILIHNLLYASTSTYMRGESDYDYKLKHLMSLKGDELLRLTNEHAASNVLSETQIYYPNSGDVDMKTIRRLEKGDYQAVIMDDTCFIREPDLTAFAMKQFNKGASVVIVGLEGIFDLSTLNRQFKVNWKCAGYSSRSIELNYLGKQILGDAFPSDHHYVKAHFIVGGGELFTEYMCPEDYEDEEDYPDGPPPPTPGSPVIMSLGESKSVSYFGFSNPLDVSYGAIMLKLCYAKAPQHSPTPSSSIAETNKSAVPSNNQQNPSVTGQKKSLTSKMLWILFLILLFYISFELFLRKKEVSGDNYVSEL